MTQKLFNGRINQFREAVLFFSSKVLTWPFVSWQCGGLSKFAALRKKETTKKLGDLTEHWLKKDYTRLIVLKENAFINFALHFVSAKIEIFAKTIHAFPFAIQIIEIFENNNIFAKISAETNTFLKNLPKCLGPFFHMLLTSCSARDWDRIRITWGNPQSGCSDICSYSKRATV